MPIKSPLLVLWRGGGGSGGGGGGAGAGAGAAGAEMLLLGLAGRAWRCFFGRRGGVGEPSSSPASLSSSVSSAQRLLRLRFFCGAGDGEREGEGSGVVSLGLGGSSVLREVRRRPCCSSRASRRDASSSSFGAGLVVGAGAAGAGTVCTISGSSSSVGEGSGSCSAASSSASLSSITGARTGTTGSSKSKMLGRPGESGRSSQPPAYQFAGSVSVAWSAIVLRQGRCLGDILLFKLWRSYHLVQGDGRQPLCAASGPLERHGAP